MIPISIELKNFGAIKEASIDFRDISLAAVTGHNGAGKSTIFTAAPLWNLFGETRSGGADDVIRIGEKECSVTFTFEHQGNTYRVVRIRTNGGRGKSSLELQKSAADNGFVSISGTTIRETQEKIIKLLNLDVETFTASSMILQGRSNEFTAKAPGQRKAILSQILGLEIYETLQEGAKKRANDIDKRLSRNNEKVREISSKLDENTGLEKRIEAVEQDIKEKTDSEAEAEKEIRSLESKLAEQNQKRTELAAKKKHADELQARKQEATSELDGINRAIAGLDLRFAEEDSLRESAERHEKAKILLAALDGKITRRDQLENELNPLRASIISAEPDIAILEGRIEKGRAIIAEKPKLEAAASEYNDLQTETGRDEQKALEVASIEQLISAIEKDISESKSSLKALLVKIESHEQKVARLAESGCVDLAAAEKAPCKFLQDAIEAKKELSELIARKRELETEISGLEDAIAGKKDGIEAVGYSKPEHESRISHLAELKPSVDALAGFEAKEELLKSLEDQYSALTKRRDENVSRRDSLSAEFEKLNGELCLVSDLKKQMEETALAVKMLAEIPALKERRSILNEKKEALEKTISQLRDEAEALTAEIDALSNIDTESYESRISDVRRYIEGYRRIINDLHANLGAMKKTKAEMDDFRAEIRRLEEERAPLAKELIEWQTLERAFSRNGIPALIIENAVPELERVSNEILGEMSGGEHSLRFETQRELKSRDGMAETLEIIVSDYRGERPYETFSGGEQLRIDLAIRFGLAEFLANRAGSKVEWIVLDEGIGSQDAEHRSMVLEAIKNVSGRFKKVFVITHIEEAQGAFEQQIRLTRHDDEVEVVIE